MTNCCRCHTAIESVFQLLFNVGYLPGKLKNATSVLCLEMSLFSRKMYRSFFTFTLQEVRIYIVDNLDFFFKKLSVICLEN